MIKWQYNVVMQNTISVLINSARFIDVILLALKGSQSPKKFTSIINGIGKSNMILIAFSSKKIKQAPVRL